MGNLLYSFQLNKLNSLKELIKNNKTYSVFEELEDQTIGKAFGINDNENIIIKVNKLI